MDYKQINALLGEAPGLTDYDQMVANRRAKTQAELAGLDEMEALIGYTTPPQLQAAKMQEITDRRNAIAADRQALETNEDYLRRYASSRAQAAYDPAPTAEREMEPYIAPSMRDMYHQPQLSEQTFETTNPTLPTDQFYPDYAAPDDIGAPVAELLRSIPRGAANTTASAPAIIGALQANSNRDAAAYLAESERILHDLAAKKLAGMDEIEFIQTASDMIEGAPQALRSKISQAIGAINAGDDPDTVIDKYRSDVAEFATRPQQTKDTPAFKMAESAHEAINETLPVRPGYEDSYTRKIGEGAGSLGPIIAGSLLGGPAGGIAMGMATQGGAATEEAVRDKADEDDILKYGLAGTAIGATEALPVGKLLGTGSGIVGRSLGILEKAAPETMAKVTQIASKLSPAGRSKLGQIAGQIIGQGVEEGAQEGLSQTLLNAAGKLTYDENRSLYEGVPESIALGAIIGGGVKGVQLAGEGALNYKDPVDTTASTDPAAGDASRSSTGSSSPSPGGGGLGGLEGEILGGDVDVAEPIAGALGQDPNTIDIDANKLRPREAEVEQGMSLGGLEGEILRGQPATAEPIAGTLGQDPTIIEGSINRPKIAETRKLPGGDLELPGSTEDYAVIDDGDDALADLADYSRKSSPSRPLQIEKREDLEVAAADAKEPTEAQKEAGNYRKGHIKVDGFDITVETPKGATRKGVAPDGQEWSVEMPGHYGYIKRTTGMDGDNVDVTVGDDIGSDKIYVIDQIDADTKSPDEHKVIMGTSSPEAARELYRRQFSDGRGDDRLGAMVEMDASTFKGWLKNGKTDKPIVDQVAPEKVIQAQDPAIEAVAKRFGMTPDEVRSVINTPVQELRRRDEYEPPSNTKEPTTNFPRYSKGTAKIGKYGDPNEAYVETLQDFDPQTLTSSEAENGIKADQSYKDYLKWAKEGKEPPPVFVAESEKGDGKLITTNRRRTLAAQEAGSKSIKGWYSRHNKETGLPLKYKDVRSAYDEAKGKPDLDKMLQDVRAKRAAREKQVTELEATGKPVRFSKANGQTALASADTANPGSFRLTRFDEKGPIGHSEYKTMREALDAGLQEGYQVEERSKIVSLDDKKVYDAPRKGRTNEQAGKTETGAAGVQPGHGQPGSGSGVARPGDPGREQTQGRVPETPPGAQGGKPGGSSARGARSQHPKAADARGRNRGRLPEPLRRFAEKEGDSEKLTLTHFGHKFHITLKPSDGWRSRGSERDMAGHPDFVPRTYYGIGTGQEGGYRKEVTGKFGHKTSIDPADLYDAATDPDNLDTGKGLASYEKAIKDAGYAGYITKVGLKGEHGPAAVVFYEAEVEEHFDDGIEDSKDLPRAKGLEKSVKLGATNKRLFVGPVKRAREVKAAYAKKAGIKPATRIREYLKVDVERATRIANEFELMKHDPKDPLVKSAYDAMIKETLDQYQAMLDAGFKAEMMTPGMADPYPDTPRLAIEDIRENNHMWVFPTDDGFGSSDLDVSDNPLLQKTKFKDINGKVMLANDVFRAVHDYFGHAVEGNGMRPRGEEMAWRVHASMYSPLARRAMTTETRGQNSWVNFGPNAEHNRTASGADTIYAPQKIGLLPEWVSSEGMHDQEHLDNIAKMKVMQRGRKFGEPASVKQTRAPKPESLIEFLARKGGIQEQTGELKSIGLTHKKTGFVSGHGPLVRQNGNPPDRAREMAEQAGYLREGSTIADLYDALAQDARSGRELFSERDQDAAERWRDAEQGLADIPFFGDVYRLAPSDDAFSKWFGDSKVVDNDGKPLVVYHGTDQSFSSFSQDKLGGATGAPSSKMGFFFASNPAVASSYAEAFNGYRDVPIISAINKLTGGLYEKLNEKVISLLGKSGYGSGANVMPVYLSIQNPMIVDFNGKKYREKSYAEIIAEAKKNGHDGVILKNTFDEGFGDGGDQITDVYVAFKPNQIKSQFNRGTYSAGTDNVLYNLAPGFYSNITRGLEKAKQVKAPAKDWKAIIAALPGVRKAEIDWIDVNGWLDGQEGQVTKEDLVNYVKANEIEIRETILTKNGVDLDGDDLFDLEIEDDPDIIDPDEEYLDQLAEDYMDQAEGEARERLDDDEEEIDTDWVKDRAREMAHQTYMENPERQGDITIRYADGSSEGFVYTQNEFGFFWEGDDYDDFYNLKDAIRGYAEGKSMEKGIEPAFMDYGTQYNSYVEGGGANYREILLSMPALEREGTNVGKGKSEYESSHFSKTPNIIVHARTTDRQNGNVLFIEEVQSDLGSDIRKEEENGREPTQDDFDRYQEMLAAQDRLRDDALAQSIDFADAIEADLKEEPAEGLTDKNSVKRFLKAVPQYYGLMETIADAREGQFTQTPWGYEGPHHTEDTKALVERVRRKFPDQVKEYLAMSQRLRDGQLRISETPDPSKWRPHSLPNFPFEGESYYHLAMKRLLRMAVDEGKSAIAWTPAYMQGRRWSQAVQNMVTKINWGETYDTGREVELRGHGIDVITVDQNGVMKSAKGGKISTDDVAGKKLSELVGKQVADQIMATPNGQLSGQQILIGGEGYKIAYDRHMKSFMEKFAKKYGSAVTVDKKLMGQANEKSVSAAVKKDPNIKPKDMRAALLATGKFDEKGFDAEVENLMQRMEGIAADYVTKAQTKLDEVKARVAAYDETDRLVRSEAWIQGELDNAQNDLDDWLDKQRQIKERKGAYYDLNAKAAMDQASDILSGSEYMNALWHLVEGSADPVWRVEITPAMRDAILEGQPFSIGREDYRLTPDAQNKIDELLAVIRKVAPNLKVRMDMSIDNNKNIWGKYSRDNGAITIAAVALQAGRGKQVFGHEALHAFVDHGLLTKQEIAILQAYADKHDLIGKYGLREQYEKAYGARGLDPADYQRMINEEGIAELVGELIGNPKAEIPGELAGMIGKLKRLLERIANAIRGLGFQTTKDILEKITSGEVGARTVEGFTPKDGELYRLGEDHVASIKRTTADDLGDFLVTDNKALRRGRALQRYLQDKFLSVKLLQRALADQISDDENAYLAEELSAARIPEQTQDMNDKMQDVLEDLHDAGISRDLFERFLRMRHAKERNEHIAKINTKFPDGGSGTRTAVAERWLTMARRITPPAKWSAMESAAQKVYAISKDSLRRRLEAGLIDQAYYSELVNQYRYYVPLKGHEFAEDLKPISNNRGYGAKGKGIMQALGRRSEAQNTLSYVVEDYRRAIYSAERNKVNVALFNFLKNNTKKKADGTDLKNDFVELDPIRYKRILVKKRGLYQGRKIWIPADFVGDNAKIASYLAGLEGNASERLRVDPTPAHNDLPVMIDGKRHIMRIKNDTLLNDLLDMHTNIERIPFFSAAMSGFTRMLTMWNPAFGPTNFVRDVMGVGLTTGSELGAKEAAKVMRDAFKMTRIILKAVRGKSSQDPDTQKLLDLYKQMKLSGGSTGFSHVVRDAETIQRELETQAEWLAGNRSTKQVLKHGIVAVDRFMEKFNRVFEDATRLAAYKNRLDAGDTDKQALSYAKNVTVNFNKRGHQGLFSQWYAFANANFQGNYRMLRAFINGKNGGKVLGGLFMGGFLYGLANILMGYDDDDPEKINSWYERNQYDKAFYIILGPIKLPKPHGFMIPFDIGTKAAELMMAGLDPEHNNPSRRSMADLTASALAEVGAQLTSFVPIGTQEDTILRFFPTLTAPIASAALNMSPFGGSLYPEGFDKTQPNWKQFYAETPEIYHKAAQWMNTLSGGNDFQAGYVDVSPEVLEFLVNSYLGGAGGELRKTSALAMTGLDAALGNEVKPIRIEDIPIIRRFFPSQRTNSLTDYYYQFSDRMQEVKNAMAEAKDGSESARAFLKEHELERRLMGQWEATKKQRTAVRKKIDALDEERLAGGSVGARRDAYINKRSLIERRFARTYQIEDQIADLQKREQTPAVRQAIAKLQRDRQVMQENVAKLMADQDQLIANRPTDQQRMSSLGGMFR